MLPSLATRHLTPITHASAHRLPALSHLAPSPFDPLTHQSQAGHQQRPGHLDEEEGLLGAAHIGWKVKKGKGTRGASCCLSASREAGEEASNEGPGALRGALTVVPADHSRKVEERNGNGWEVEAQACGTGRRGASVPSALFARMTARALSFQHPS